MLSLLKSTSRTVHHHNDEEHENYNNNYTSNNHEKESCISLTVWRKSLLFSCKGFTVIGADGNLVYRVDNYRNTPNETILMDASGNPIFTICRRKKLSLVDREWFVYEGEVDSSSSSINSPSKKPVLYVRKNTSILRIKQSVLAYVYDGMSEKGSYAYMIEGSYMHRSCKILDETKRVVAEIRRKEPLKGCGVSFGFEVFHLVVRPGIDSRYAMAIVLLLDQMFS